MGNAFEVLVYDGMLSIVGEPLFLGLIVFGWFACFTMLQNINTPAKFAVLVPAAILSATFVPFGLLLVGLVVGFVLYLLLMKLIAK